MGLFLSLNHLDLFRRIRNGWLIFDRDEVKEFDDLVLDAEKNGINVGWSNPCFEIWLHSYFGEMPVSISSELCCKKFGYEFEKKTNQKYQKSDQKIYDKLIQFGDEKKAIITARKRHSKSLSDFDKPSEMLSTSKVYVLVDEIVKIIENN